jgi:hypothetical protein
VGRRQATCPFASGDVDAASQFYRGGLALLAHFRMRARAAFLVRLTRSSVDHIIPTRPLISADETA